MISCIIPLKDNRNIVRHEWAIISLVLVTQRVYFGACMWEYMCRLLIRQKIGLINTDYGRLSVAVPVSIVKQVFKYGSVMM